MYDNFDDFYNETYNNFYNACEFKDLISSEPIPHKIDETLNSAGKYENGIIYIKPSSLKSNDEIKRMCSLLYHELTHYYDDVMFHHIGYSEDDINNVLLLTYSEIHAAYNGMFAFLNLKNLSINKKININKIVFESQTLVEFCAKQTAFETTYMNNSSGFKYAMYLLGEKRALFKIADNTSVISRIYNPKCIPENIRSEISNIDKLINLNSYENIDVEQININQYKAHNTLLRHSIENIGLSGIESVDNEIRNLLDNLK